MYLLLVEIVREHIYRENERIAQKQKVIFYAFYSVINNAQAK